MSQTWSDKLRAGRQSLCGGDAASSTPRGTLPEKEECWGFVVGTARDSSSEGKHRSERLRSVQQHRERSRFQSTMCDAEEHTQLQGRIARTIRCHQLPLPFFAGDKLI